MPTVEGLTPAMLWYFMYALFAIGLLFLIGFRVYDAIHTLAERKKQRKESEKPDFAEQVSKKVVKELEPRLKEIEANLDKDKRRLETHEQLIAGMQNGQKEIHDGLSAIAKFMLVISNYGNIGDNEHVKEASVELQKFLAEKM